MDLWIRSQDQKVLVNVSDLAIRRFIDEDTLYSYQIVGYFDKNTEFEVLGIYQKEERALEVLDEICNYMTIDKNEYEDKYKICYQECRCYKSDILMIYEMPEE